MDTASGLKVIFSQQFAGSLTSGAFSADDKYIAVSEFLPRGACESISHAYILDEKYSSPWIPNNPIVQTSEVEHLAFTSEKMALITASMEGKFCIWEVPGLSQRGWPLALPGIGAALRIRSFSSSKSADVIVAAAWDKAYVWRIKPEMEVSLLSIKIDLGVGTFLESNRAVLNNPKTMVLTSSQYTAIWDSRNGTKIGSNIPRAPGWAIADFDPSGACAVVGASDGSALVWDINNNRVASRWKPHTGPILCASFSPDGKFVLTASENGTARIWDYRRQELIGNEMQMFGEVQKALFSPDGSYVLTGSGVHTVDAPHKLALWRASSGDLLAEQTSTSAFSALSFSSDGRRILAATRRGLMSVYAAP